MPDNPVVLYEERDSLAIITLNRPEKMNTLNNDVIQGIADGIDAATASPDVSAIVLRGAGRTFTAGYDLNPGSNRVERPRIYGAEAIQARPGAWDPVRDYQFMGEALAEARVALSLGERPIAAVAVVNDAMVARAHDRVQASNDPTAHAVVVALREAARKLGSARLGEATIFATLEPCAMCVGALLESDVEALVYACPNTIDGAAGSIIQLAQHPDLPRRLRVVSGIRRDEAEELFATEASDAAQRNGRAAQRV